MLLLDAMRGYLIAAHAENKAPKTLSAVEWHTRKFTQWLETQNLSTDLDRITPQHLRQFLSYEAGRGLAPHSVHAHYKTLAPLLRWAIAEHLTTNDPLHNVRPPKLPTLLPKVLTFQQVESLLKHLRKHARVRPTRTNLRNLAIFTVFLGAGLRANELCGLELQDIHLESQFLVVREGKGGKQRVVPLRPAILKVLWRYIHQWRDELEPLTPHLFVSTRGFALNANNVERMCRRTLAKCDVRGGTHILRHTFATLYVQNGGDIKRLQMILGHSSVSITERYVHLSNRDVLPSSGPPVLDRLGL